MMLSLYILSVAIEILDWCLVVYCILIWLMQNRIVLPQNRILYSLYALLSNIVEPFLVPIRSVVPPLRGLDLSPIVLILILKALSYCLNYIFL